jgi:hypothetical protein
MKESILNPIKYPWLASVFYLDFGSLLGLRAFSTLLSGGFWEL